MPCLISANHVKQAEAPAQVVSAMSAASSGDMSKEDQLTQLQRMQDLIARTMEQIRSQA
jgi:hypothetical protein